MNKLIKLVCLASLFISMQLATAQEINFDDLQRPGIPLVQSKTIGGLASEGSSYMRQFSETDSARIEAARQARASYSSSSGSSTSSSSSSSNNSSGSWKRVRTYQGGFSQFGLAKHKTVHVIQCGNGRNTELYQLDNGKWTTFSTWFDATSTFESAANSACK